MLESIEPSIPLIVDLDDTLVRTDTLHEALISVLFRTPLALPKLFLHLFRGRATLKEAAASTAKLNAEFLSYRQEVLDLVHRAKSTGRSVHLVTAADQLIADAVQQHLGCFDSVKGSDGKVNLKGRKKLAWLNGAFPAGFIYVGDSASDLPIWKAAKGAILVGKGVAHADRLREFDIPVVTVMEEKTNRLKDWLSELRLHQWAKNILIAVPLFLGHIAGDYTAVAKTVVAILVFSLVASASYIINDLADIEADRKHPTKRNRAIAAGRISVAQGAIAAVLLLGLGLTAGFLLAPAFAAAMLGYVVLTLAYSFSFKRVAMLDVAAIAALFTMRIVMGSVLHDLPLSPWLNSFSAFFFFSLSLAKRNVELMRAKATGKDEVAGRGYTSDDWPMTLAFGVASAVASIVVMLLFITDQARVSGYTSPNWLFIAPICAFLWVSRIWLLSFRMELDDDPVVFALKDKVSYLLGLIILMAFLLAQ